MYSDVRSLGLIKLFVCTFQYDTDSLILLSRDYFLKFPLDSLIIIRFSLFRGEINFEIPSPRRKLFRFVSAPTILLRQFGPK